MLDQLQEELKIAMKAGEKAKMMGLRNIIGKIKAAQIDKGETLTDEESSKILKTAAKQLKESIDQYQKGGRDDLAEKEAFELTLLEKYLPEQLSEEQIRQTVKNIVKNTGAGSMQDMGKVMGATMQELAGSADGKIVQKIVQEELSS
ncbi:MAG TPA: GatB/YqeY domain-containing protein [Candidatus Marinimicrobia bacterium]|nr:GatB/YqeY domain-containing protein [Candidatus Neomarinimicrobiota bacterium]